MTDAGRQPTLKVEGLTKKFAEHTLWSRLSFDAGPGSIIAVSGPSGAGKTTLLNCIGLLEDFNEGSVTYSERTFRSGYLHKSRKGQRVCLRENIGFLFQNYGLVEQWNVSHNLQIPLKMKKRFTPYRAGNNRESPSRDSCSNSRMSFLQTNRPLRWIRTTPTS